MTRIGVVGAVAGGIVGFVRGADIGTDAPEEQRSTGALRMAFINSCGVTDLPDTKQLARLGAQLDFLRRTRKDTAPSGDQRLVIVLPARSRQREQSLALGKTGFRIGIRIDENIAVVESRQQPDRVFTQHAIAEYVARHVPDADDIEWRLANVDIHFAEMPLHRFPGTARGNAHGLVVVAGRATRCESVAKPIAVLN